MDKCERPQLDLLPIRGWGRSFFAWASLSSGHAEQAHRVAAPRSPCVRQRHARLFRRAGMRQLFRNSRLCPIL